MGLNLLMELSFFLTPGKWNVYVSTMYIDQREFQHRSIIQCFSYLVLHAHRLRECGQRATVGREQFSG